MRLRLSVAKTHCSEFLAERFQKRSRRELSWNNLAHDTTPPLTHLGPLTLKVTLPDGMLVTNPEQFTDEREEYETELLEDTTTS